MVKEKIVLSQIGQINHPLCTSLQDNINFKPTINQGHNHFSSQHVCKLIM